MQLDGYGGREGVGVGAGGRRSNAAPIRMELGGRLGTWLITCSFSFCVDFHLTSRYGALLPSLANFCLQPENGCFPAQKKAHLRFLPVLLWSVEPQYCQDFILGRVQDNNDAPGKNFGSLLIWTFVVPSLTRRSVHNRFY